MMTVCVIGNSHVAALKAAWPADLKTVYFCSKGQTLKNLKSEGNALVPTNRELKDRIRETSGGLERIDIDQYDLFLLVGLGLGLRHLWPSYGPHRLAEDMMGRKTLISESCLFETFFDILNDTLAIRMARNIRSKTKSPVIVIPEPNPPEQYAQRRINWRKDSANQRLHNVSERCLEKLEQEYHISVMKQPSKTLSGILTQDNFSVAYAEDTPISDASIMKLLHMNKEYGAIVVDQLVKTFVGETV